MSDSVCFTVKSLRSTTVTVGRERRGVGVCSVDWEQGLKAQVVAVKLVARVTRVGHNMGRQGGGSHCDGANTHTTMCGHGNRVCLSGYLHHDIKPDNARVNAEGDVVIIDDIAKQRIYKCTLNGVYDQSPAAEVWSVGFIMKPSWFTSQ